MLSTLSTGFARAFQAALPNHCALCGNLSQHAVCSPCARAAPRSGVRCPCCAEPLDGARQSSRCASCVALSPAFDATLTFADYAAPYDALAQALKFSAQLGLARWFAAQLAAQAAVARLAPDLVLAVPLSAHRLAYRGYNQAWEIARPLARHLNAASHATLLYRSQHTPPQTGLSDARQRRHNVRGAFAIAASPRARVLADAHVAVVDDVMTSGATLNEIARLLKQAGAARVTNLVALRTPPPSRAAHTAPPITL